ncbi:3-mercaptopyruvate sulfurtransferase [Variibacter gotjawalensis]|uniref:3-mercaptopyruvate sulfurtransferase n=1 Tax=Variibacter gotjawalensis TaxID=1333996 RepID=A0A0S3PP02_9BRAD|nr:sulfurtransferase [Variibacter gotjawalensis]NIK47963.1 thiosulfate/3-mercaptopyruvate sulfurtransferase [Variibacter gotjawalensis]RZS49840.1 thiosulfate/3-mercaptopyruvate sulfurtransferase [Variibacter gotjawalensis]BAT57669.1 3-mercaptopyruvate sulfurtransferase [Variibacter gotjawalensis]
MKMGLIVETEWLAYELDDPDLRIFDCSVKLIPHPTKQYTAEPQLEAYRAGHIPRAAFIDVANDLSDKNSPLRFTAQSPDDFAAAMSRLGVGDTSKVVLYSTTTWYWAARVWWLLRANGFDNVALLDGSWKKWTAERRPVATGEEHYPPAEFIPKPRYGFFCTKDDVLAALQSQDTHVLNALTAEQHDGTGGTTFDRPGHITGSINVPAKDLVDPDTNLFLSPDAIRAKFEAAGVLERGKTIAYCGGGIAATGDAFGLALIGRGDVSIYDASLNEWGADPSLPMTTGR